MMQKPNYWQHFSLRAQPHVGSVISANIRYGSRGGGKLHEYVVDFEIKFSPLPGEGIQFTDPAE